MLMFLACGSFFIYGKGEVNQLDLYPDDMLILKFTMGSRILLADNIIAYPNAYSAGDDSVYNSIALSLLEFVEAIEFPIEVISEQGQASGWFIEQHRTFELDLKAGIVTIAGQKEYLQPQQLQWYGDEIFVDIDLLAKWFGLNFNYQSNQQSLDMSANEVLPFQRKWAREAQREKLNRWLENNRDAEQYKLNLPLFESEYDFVSTPRSQIYSNIGYKYHKDGVEGRFYQYSGTVYHDLLYQNAKWYFKGDEKNELDDIRLTLGRQDESKKLAGLGLSSYQIGDSYSFDVPLISHSTLGFGASVSSFDLGFRSRTNVVTLRGDSQPGWDIELYRNNALINGAKVRKDGTYEFVDVPLLSGINDIKLVFYGPRGEKQEKVERYYMHPDLARAGEFTWRASVHRDNQLLFDNDHFLGQSPHVGRARAVVQTEYGFSDSLSLSAGFVALPAQNEAKTNKYVTVGSRFTAGASYFRQQFIKNVTDNTQASELFISADVGQLNVNGSYQYFSKGFVSDYRRYSAKPLKSQVQLNMHQSIQTSLFSHLSFGVKAKHQKYHDGETLSEVSLKQSVAKLGLSLTNEIFFDNGVLDGQTTFNLPTVYDIRFRGKLRYALAGGLDAESLSISAETRLSDNYHLTADVNRSWRREGSSRFGFHLVREYEGFDLDLSAGYQSGGHYNVSVSFSMQMDDFGFADKDQSELGRVNARVFLDNNGNKTFDEGDTPIPEVHFSVDGRASDDVTDDLGIVSLDVDANVRAVIKISPGIFGDHYWDVEIPEIAVLAREGKTLTVNFAAMFNGEIEGSVYLDEQFLKPLSGVVVELVDAQGNIVNSVKSGFDGFYLFEKVPFGRYQVQIEAVQLIKQKLPPVSPQNIEVSSDNDIVSGVDFYLDD